MKRLLKSDLLIFLILIIGYSCLLLFRLNLDLWNDEIYTLKNFVLVPISQTITDYHVPNNHSFFNLLNNLYLRIINVDDINILLDKPYLIRIPPFLYTIVALIVLGFICKRFYNTKVSILAILVLATSIPFFNFALQVRGYSLSIMLAVALFYYYLAYLRIKQTRALFYIGLFAALLFYTLPSNLYILLGFIGCSGLEILYLLIKHKSETIKQNIVRLKSQLLLVASFVLGILLALLFYSPVLKDVFFNDYVSSSHSFDFSVIHSLPLVLKKFLSGRWFLLIIFATGLILLLSKFKDSEALLKDLLLITVVIITPFILGFLRGMPAPDRIYIVLIPLFALTLAIGIDIVLSNALVRRFSSLVIFLLVVVSVVTFVSETRKVRAAVTDSIAGDYKLQDLYYNYYLWNYTPHKDVEQFRKLCYNDSSLVLIEGAEPHDLPNYLRRFGIHFYEEDSFDSCLMSICQKQKPDTFYVFSKRPNTLLKKANEQKFSYVGTYLKQNLTYHNVLQFININLLKLKVEQQFLHLDSTYGDSIRYLFDTPFNQIDLTHKTGQALHNKTLVSNIYELENITPSYIAYFRNESINESNIEDYLKFNYRKVYSNSNKPISVSVYQRNSKTKGNTAFFNDFEQNNPMWGSSECKYDSADFFSGTRSLFLDSANVYSSTFSIQLSELANGIEDLIVKTTFNYKFRNESKVIAVFHISRGKNTIQWEGMDLLSSEQDKWETAIMLNKITKDTKPSDLLKIYIWNPNGAEILLDNFKVEFFEDKSKY